MTFMRPLSSSLLSLKICHFPQKNAWDLTSPLPSHFSEVLGWGRGQEPLVGGVAGLYNSSSSNPGHQFSLLGTRVGAKCGTQGLGEGVCFHVELYREVGRGSQERCLHRSLGLGERRWFLRLLSGLSCAQKEGPDQCLLRFSYGIQGSLRWMSRKQTQLHGTYTTLMLVDGSLLCGHKHISRLTDL